MNSGYILFSEGQYSDYQNTAYAVLKPFRLKDVTLMFMDQWKPHYEWETKPDSCEFIAWMNKEGYIRDTPEIPEIHLGGYHFEPERIGLKLMRREFAPLPHG